MAKRELKPTSAPTRLPFLKLRAARRAMVEKMRQPASEAALNDPELMRIWGECNSLWDDITQLLWVAFDSMLDVDQATTRALFFAPENDTASRKMVTELAKQRVHGEFTITLR